MLKEIDVETINNMYLWVSYFLWYQFFLLISQISNYSYNFEAKRLIKH
jgi:hypothetical protein